MILELEELGEYGFHYITAITKPQIETLIKSGVIQLNLIDQRLAEVLGDNGMRYVLRRIPARAKEIRKSCEDKLKSLRKELARQNE